MESSTQTDAKFTQSHRFLIQLLLHRYQQLLNRLETQFVVSPEQRVQLNMMILTHEWIYAANQEK